MTDVVAIVAIVAIVALGLTILLKGGRMIITKKGVEICGSHDIPSDAGGNDDA